MDLDHPGTADLGREVDVGVLQGLLDPDGLSLVLPNYFETLFCKILAFLRNGSIECAMNVPFRSPIISLFRPNVTVGLF